MMIEKDFINRHLGIKFKSYVDEDCNVWFKGKEVAQNLGYKKTRNAIEKHVSKKYKKEAPIQGPLGGEQNCIIINEPGFYELVFKSKLPTAIFFRDWVFSIVLPSIRKYGYYNKFKKENKRLIIVDGVEYYKHQIFFDYAANKDGDIYSLKKIKIKILMDIYILEFIIKNWKNQSLTIIIDLFTRFFADQFRDVLRLTISTLVNLIIG